jgi:hypothetical protein
MPLKLTPKLMRLHNAMPPQLRQQVNSIIVQVKGGRLPLTLKYTLFRGLWTKNPHLTAGQRVLLTVYIQAQAGLLDNLTSLDAAQAAVFTAQASSFNYTSASFPTVGGSLVTTAVALQPGPTVSPKYLNNVLKNIRGQIQDRLDSMNDLSDEGSTELQMLILMSRQGR